MAPEMTCSKCMYLETPHYEFPCDICLNSGKLVENMVEPNWAPQGAVLAEKPVVKRCNNCRFGPLETYQYPCNHCLEEVDFERFWEPEEEKVEYKTTGVLNNVKFSWVSSDMGEVAVKPLKPFWIVCADGGSLEAHVRHDSEESATREANRLALKTGKTFQVFKSVAKVTGKTTARQEKYA